MWNLKCKCQITIIYRFATSQNAEIAKLTLYYLDKCSQENENSVNKSVSHHNIFQNVVWFPKDSLDTQFKLPLFLYLFFYFYYYFFLLYKLSFSNQMHSLFQYISKIQLHKKCIFLFLDFFFDTGTPTI